MKKIGFWMLIALLVMAPAAMATTVTFAGLGGANGDPFASYAESGYTVTATGGSWFVAQIFGNPTPDIYAGPIDSPSISTVSVTGIGLFTFGSVDLASNNGQGSNYDIEGSLNGSPIFAMLGSLPGGCCSFNTITSAFPGLLIDTLTITLTPLSGVTSMNLDNINVNAVPEPGTLLLLGTGLAGLGRKLRRKA